MSFVAAGSGLDADIDHEFHEREREGGVVGRAEGLRVTE